MKLYNCIQFVGWIAFSLLIGCGSENKPSLETLSIIPAPLSVEMSRGTFDFSAPLSIQVVGEFDQIDTCVTMLNTFMKMKVGAGPTRHRLSILSQPLLEQEEYELTVGENGISLSAASSKGVFYGLQTFFQLFPEAKASHYYLPCVTIKDKPRFPYRGLMVDPARRFIPMESLRKYVDQMAFYKFNKLHLHLSDNQGWRVEIKSMPRLASNQDFYTQDELKSLVTYASARGIEIIPEIDIPGHSVAAIAAYPELSCTGKQIKIRTTPGQSKELLCVGNERVFEYLENVISELSDIFPAADFHLGGDEAPLDCWKKCPACQRLMKKNGYTDEHQLFVYLYQRADSLLAKYHKKPMLWFETNVSTYPQNVTMYSWRIGLSAQVIADTKARGYKLVCAPGEYAYFDYPQWPGDEPQPNWGMPTLPLKQAYEFDPTFGLPAEQTDHIIGVEGTLWGECISDVNRLFYMTYPRALALAEAGWCEMDNRSWEKFCKKLDYHLPHLLHQGVNYRVPVELYSE